MSTWRNSAIVFQLTTTIIPTTTTTATTTTVAVIITKLKCMQYSAAYFEFTCSKSIEIITTVFTQLSFYISSYNTHTDDIFQSETYSTSGHIYTIP
jgi:hypothetical protein